MWLTGTALNFVTVLQRRFAGAPSQQQGQEHDRRGLRHREHRVLRRTADVPRAIRNGLAGDASLLAIKSVLDGFSAIVFAATLGWGVLLSLVVIVVYPGGIAAGAAAFAGLLTDAQLRELSAVSGLLLVGVGLKLLKIRDVQVADHLPAIGVAPLLMAAASAVGGLAQ